MLSESRWILSLLALALVTVVAPGCEADAPAVQADAATVAAAVEAEVPHVVRIRGMDYQFEAPAEIPSGWVTFEFENQGPEPHHVVVARLEEGRTFEELVSALAEHRPLTGIATALGGPNVPDPGVKSNATMYLEPGEHALLCVIPSSDGLPHFAKGMIQPLTVTAERSSAAEPAADVDITMVDYAYDVSAPITAGERTLHVRTDEGSTEPHDIVLARFSEGKTIADLGEWMQTMEGPPPARFLGGTSVLDPGEAVFVTADFAPGDYALVCPVHSPDGTVHAEKGMVHVFTVD